MANPTVPSNSLPSTLAWASNVAPAVAATSSLTATVNVLPATVSTTIPTVNAVPVVNSLPAPSGTMNVTSAPNMNLPMSTATGNALNATHVPQVAAPAPAVMATSTTNTTAIPTVVPSSLPLQGSPSRAPIRTAPVSAAGTDLNKVLDKQRLSELVKEVDPLEQLDDEVEDLLMQVADDFIDNVVTAAAQLAQHRKANSVEVKDVQLHLERNWNMWIPGFGSSEEPRPYKKAATTEAHKQRMALIKKTLKKY